MSTGVGLRLALTIYAFVGVVLPEVFLQHLYTGKQTLDGYAAHLRLRIKYTRRHGQYLLRSAKNGIANRLCTPKSPLLDLPAEIRLEIWQWVCTPQPDGTVWGVLNLLLINRQINAEAKSLFDNIEHVIHIGDVEKFDSNNTDYWGLPRLVGLEKLDWHMASLKHLVLEVGICGIGTMTPDCFDVYISYNGKEQWRNLKRLIGIWPQTREIPLESIRLDLAVSQYDTRSKLYRADLIRVIRNFKRTKVWAETGDCSIHKGNKSVLLPLVRAFNQGRSNWVKESDEDNNLIVRYDTHMLKKHSFDIKNDKDERAEFEADRQRWSIIPVNDTTRSDNSVWPEWTGKEAKYISEKMLQRVKHELDRELMCHECLAVFYRPKELWDHIQRGRWRS